MKIDKGGGIEEGGNESYRCEAGICSLSLPGEFSYTAERKLRTAVVGMGFIGCHGLDQQEKPPLSLPPRVNGMDCVVAILSVATSSSSPLTRMAFLRAWEAACRTPGAVELIIPKLRTFLVGPVYFKGRCRSDFIHVQILGNITAPASPSHWKGHDMGHWLSFYQVHNLIIDGTGTINGMGSAWWDCKRRQDKALEIMQCEHVSVSGITTLNSQGVHVKIGFSQDVTVSNIKIIAPKDSPNTDGINMGGSQYVRIQDCTIRTGDDCIAMLAGSSHINISRISCGPGHGVSIGSLGRYSQMDKVDHIGVTDVNFFDTMNGARIKTWQKEAVKIQGVSFIGAVGTTTSDVAINLKCSSSVPCTEILLRDVNLTAAVPHEKTRAYCSNTRGQFSSIVSPRVPCL
ncbi:probable polygalacturonase At3g15720 [Nymphaea colorata]|nr:probable polygalacturonase At3g15720 [Nymphaea colorata]